MSALILRNARIFDGNSADCLEGTSLRVEGDRIVELSSKPIAAPDAQVIDVGGRTLMPGLIDAHVHALAADVAAA